VISLRFSYLKFFVLIVMSLFGIWSSMTVLYLYDIMHQPLPFCVVGSQQSSGVVLDCYKVLGSSYANVYGVPLDALAAVWFIINLLLVILVSFASDKISIKSLRALFVWRFFGLALVPYLVFLELFVVKAICVYCTIMHVAIIIDFIIVTYLLFYKHNAQLFLKK